MILKIFFYGVLITVPVFFIQIGLSQLTDKLSDLGFFSNFPIVIDIIKWFIIIALIEETLKYVVVKLSILGSPELDEPLDIMLYMVVAALGFAALENVLYLFSPDNASLSQTIQTAAVLSFIRFVGATFLHTLCSALVGYFLALASLRANKKILFTFIGIILATLLHGFYDFSIIIAPSPFNFIIPVMIIAGLAIFIMYDFDEVKKIKGICKI